MHLDRQKIANCVFGKSWKTLKSKMICAAVQVSHETQATVGLWTNQDPLEKGKRILAELLIAAAEGKFGQN